MTNPKSNGKALNPTGLAGACLILFGLTANSRVLAHFLTADGTIDSSGIRLSIIVMDALAMSAGAFLLAKRKTLKLVNLVLFSASLLTSLLVAASVCQLICSPSPIISGWRARVGHLEQNQLGFRGHKIAYSEDDYVILIVGDSHVEAVACSFDYMPERRLEHHLNLAGKRVKVFSLAAGGYGQDQQLLALQEYYTKHRADLVLLWQTPDNDVWNNTWPTHWPTNANPKPTFWIEDGELKGPTERIGNPVALPSIKILAMFARSFPYISRRDTLWEARLPAAYQPMKHYTGPVNMIWQQRWDEDDGRMRLENLESEKSHLAIRLTPRSQRMVYGLELTRQIIQKMESVAHLNGSRLLIFDVIAPTTSPMTEDGVYSLHGKYYRVSQKQLRENMDYVNKGFAFTEIHVSLEKWRVGPYDSHFNEHATDEAMMRLAGAIKDRF